MRLLIVEQKNRTGSGVINATTDAQRTAPLEHNQHFAEIVPMGMRLHPMLMTRILGGCRAMSLKTADPDPARRARHDARPDFGGIFATSTGQWLVLCHK